MGTFTQGLLITSMSLILPPNIHSTFGCFKPVTTAERLLKHKIKVTRRSRWNPPPPQLNGRCAKRSLTPMACAPKHLFSHYVESSVTCTSDQLEVLFKSSALRSSSDAGMCSYTCVLGAASSLPHLTPPLCPPKPEPPSGARAAL